MTHVQGQRRATNRTNTEVGSVLIPVQGGIQGMNWVFHTANRKSEVNLGITREPPSIPNTAPNRTKRRIGDSSIDSISNLPGDLGQTEASVQDHVQLVPSIDNRGGIDRFAVRAGDAIRVQDDLPVLVTLFAERDLSDGELWHVRDVFKAGDEFADGYVSGIGIRGVIGPPEQGGDVVGRGSVVEEDTVQD